MFVLVSHIQNFLQAERIDLEERYTSLQEEAAGKTRKLKKVWTLLMAAKSELGDMQAEHQREMEALLESVRHLSREHKLHQLIIDSFIPLEYQVSSLVRYIIILLIQLNISFIYSWKGEKCDLWGQFLLWNTSHMYVVARMVFMHAVVISHVGQAFNFGTQMTILS